MLYQGPRNFLADRLKRDDLAPLLRLRHLQKLSLNGVDGPTDNDLDVLANLVELEDLDLDRTVRERGGPGYRGVPLTDRVLDHIQGLPRLKFLVLSANRITDEGLAKLANLKALESLDLDGTLVTDAGLDRLVRLKSLKTLRVESTRVTTGGVARFQQKRPEVEVIHESAPMDFKMSRP